LDGKEGPVRSFDILVVEDFPAFREFICSLLLQRKDFRITQASDGLEAVQKAEQLQPDLILLDIGLPVLNGMQAARFILDVARSAKIIFLTAESDQGLVQEALNLGALGYVHKPRAKSDLLHAIEAVLRGERFVSRGLGLNGRTELPRRHEVQFYSVDSVLLESFGRFIAAALIADNPAVVVATKSHREGLVQKLEAEGFDVDRATKRGTYISLDAGDMLSTIMIGDTPDSVRFSEGLSGLVESAGRAAKREHPRIALCAECTSLLCAQGKTNAAVRLETVGKDLIQRHNLDILCSYALSSFIGDDDPVLRSISQEHTCVYSR
jgi:DNA-binding NarL/FixJ family response regulator